MLPLSTISIPCIFTSNRAVFWAKAYENFTWCTSYGVKTGYFDDLRIIDRRGIQYSTIYLGVDRGAGRFGGYNLFFNRRFYANLSVAETGRVYTLRDILPIAKKAIHAQWRTTELENEIGDVVEAMQQVSSIDELYSIIDTNTNKKTYNDPKKKN
jgi:hypothetical protein